LPSLPDLIHPRRNACAFRVRPFEQSTGLFNPALPDRASPPHGAGQRMQSIRVTDRAKACLRGVGASLPTPRFGRGGPDLGHLIHPRRNACAFRVRDFEQSTGLFNPASPDRLSPHPHGAGQRMQSIRVTDRAKACLRGAGTSLPTPRFGRGGPCLGHLIHLRRKACAFRVRPFDPSTGLLSPTKPNHASHQRSHRTAR